MGLEALSRAQSSPGAGRLRLIQAQEHRLQGGLLRASCPTQQEILALRRARAIFISILFCLLGQHDLGIES